MEIKIQKLSGKAIIPTKMTKGSAAYDLFAPFDQIITHGRQVIDLYLALELPFGYEAKVEPRSEYASKGFVGALDNTQEPNIRFDCDVLLGKIDSDYRLGIGVSGAGVIYIPFWKAREVMSRIFFISRSIPLSA